MSLVALLKTHLSRFNDYWFTVDRWMKDGGWRRKNGGCRRYNRE